MKRTILTLIDASGSSKDKNGRAYGFFMGNEKQLCETYYNENGLNYKMGVVNISDPERVKA